MIYSAKAILAILCLFSLLISIQANPVAWDQVTGYRRQNTCINAVVGPGLESTHRNWSPQQCADECNTIADCAGFQYGHNEYKIAGSQGHWCTLKTTATMDMIRSNGWICPPTADAVYGFYLKETSSLPSPSPATWETVHFDHPPEFEGDSETSSDRFKLESRTDEDIEQLDNQSEITN